MTTEVVDFAAEWQAWHDARERRLRDLRAFLSVTGLHWLTEEPQRFEDVPGAWSSGADGVVVVLAEGEALRVGEDEIAGRHVFGAVDGAGVWAEFAGATGPWTSVVEIADRFGSAILRPRHLDSPNLSSYEGTPAFAVDPRWRVEARWEPFETPQATSVGTVVDGATSTFTALGTFAFDLDGPRRLLAFDDGDGGLWILFRDATAGSTTYVIRQLQTSAPRADGTVTLDFNRAANMPCAYTPYATCPLPPPENVLPVAIAAGEKVPVVRR